MDSYYKRNKERLKAKALENYYANKADKLAYAKKYRKENMDKISEYSKEYWKTYKRKDR